MAKKSPSEQSKQKKRAPQQQVSWFLSSWRPYLFTAIVAFLVYARTLNYGFVGFDDQVFVGNPMFSRWQDVWGQFTMSASSEAYRPVMFASITLNSLIFGQTSAFGFHFVNVMLHVIACVLLFGIFVRLNYERGLSLALTVLFAAHPLLTQATAWVPGRNDTFVAVWLFASFIFLVMYVEKNSIIALILHFVLFTIANFTKESSVVMPGVCAVYMLFIVREKLFSQRMIMLTVIWLVIDLVYIYIRTVVPHAVISKSYSFNYLYGFEAMAAGWRAIPEFLGKMVVPVNQSGYTIFTTFSTVVGIIVSIVVVAGVVFALLKRESTRWQYVAFGAAWWFLFLILPMIRYQLHTAAFEQDYLEHRAYIPLAGLLMILAECIREFTKSGSRFRMQILGGIYVVAAVFGIMTINYATQYVNGLTFWRAIITYNPQSALAWNSVGYFMMESQMPMNEVEPYMQKAVELAPTDVRYLNGLAVVHIRQNKGQLAIEELRRAAKMDSTFSDGVYNLGYMLQSTQGATGVQEAKKLYEQAIRGNPAHFNAHLNLIVISIQEGNIAKAKELYKHGLDAGIDVAKAQPTIMQYLR